MLKDIERTASIAFQCTMHSALLYRDSVHYDPKTCIFVNLFDVEQADRLQHFTRMTVLTHLSVVSQAHPTLGFARLSDVLTHLTKVGYSSAHASWTVKYLFEKACLESRDPMEKWSEDIREIKLTSLGKYHITELLTFAYFDAMTIDTPIMDTNARGRIYDVMDIRGRIDRTLVFLEYLDAASKDILDLQVRQLWDEHLKAVMDGMSKIQDTVDEQEADDVDDDK